MVAISQEEVSNLSSQVQPTQQTDQKDQQQHLGEEEENL